MDPIDYTMQLDQIILNQETIIENLELSKTALLQLNGYLFIIVLLMIGVGMIYLFYRFLKIFL